MKAHVRNDVKQSVGLVVTSYWLELSDVSSIPVRSETCVNLDRYKPSFGSSKFFMYFWFF